jgi:protein subunit release factor B
MYTCWARRQGCKQGLIEQIVSTSGNIQFAAMEIESEHMFGILSGEKGMHTIINSSNENSSTEEVINYLFLSVTNLLFSVQAIKHKGYITKTLLRKPFKQN